MPDTQHFSNADVLEVDVGSIVGPIFIGNIINWMLLGTLITQMYTYHQKFAKDRIFITILVYTVFGLDVAQTIMLTDHGWWFIINIWGKPEEFDFVPWSACMIVFMCGLVAGIVQLFYAWRIWALARTKVIIAIAILIVLMALTQSISAMVTAILLLLDPNQKAVLRLHPGFTIWLSGSLATDVFITTCMTYILYTAKMKTAWADSETLLGRMVRITVQTGLATVVTACIDLFLFVHFTNNDFHLVPAYVLGKLYSNSLLLSLNLRNSRSDHVFPTQSQETVPMHSIRSRATRTTDPVYIERRTERHTDTDAPEIELWTTDASIQNKRYSESEEREHRGDFVAVDMKNISRSNDNLKTAAMDAV
ncbi:hypothetical protein FB451DRAFT_1288030 [Mycena latifolia]|nr:hypothetical protein FB451DRAFT_1288030 [Mycena latifolia]